MANSEFRINSISTEQIKYGNLFDQNEQKNIYEKNEQAILYSILLTLMLLLITRSFYYADYNGGALFFLAALVIVLSIKYAPIFYHKYSLHIDILLVASIFILLASELFQQSDLFNFSMAFIILLLIMGLTEFVLFYSNNRKLKYAYLGINILIALVSFLMDISSQSIQYTNEKLIIQNSLMFSYLAFIGFIILMDFFVYIFLNSTTKIKIILGSVIVFLFLMVSLPGEILFDPGYLFSIFFNVVSLLWTQILITGLILAAFVYKFRKDKLLGIGLGIMFIFIVMAIFAPFLAPRDFATPDKICGTNQNQTCRLNPPNSKFIMGTTVFGLDVYSRVIWGAQIPLQMSFITALICFSLGVPFGLVSGYYGGKVDSIMKTISDIIVSFPPLVLAILLSTFIKNIPFVDPESNLRIILVVSFSVGIVYIPIFFVIARSIVLQLKESAFVEAARSMGASDFTIMFRYILPNIIAAPMAMIPFSMTDAILTGASLAFLGIGIVPPTADWGYDMTAAIDKITSAPWLITFPGIMLFLLAFAFSLIGDSLNEKYNPLLQQREA